MLGNYTSVRCSGPLSDLGTSGSSSSKSSFSVRSRKIFSGKKKASETQLHKKLAVRCATART